MEFAVTVLIFACDVDRSLLSGQERDQPRSPERDQPRSPERDQPREEAGPLTVMFAFQPQNERERALWNMIQQLRSEVCPVETADWQS